MTETFEEVYEAIYRTISLPPPSAPLEKHMAAMSQFLLNLKTEMDGLDNSMERYSNAEERGATSLWLFRAKPFAITASWQ